MIGSLAAPGPVGFVVGGLLIAAGVKVWWSFTGRRAHADPVAETAPAYTIGRVRLEQPRWHPSMGPRRQEPVTELLPRCSDMPDATLLIPRQRAVRHTGGGGR